jgi:hypothetical protein
VWLREQRKGDVRIVGVFAGLANFIVESDSEVQPDKPDSREQQMKNKNYYPKGSKFNPPFYQTTTMGCRLDLLANNADAATGRNEYTRAIYYGRPLFALMAKANNLDGNISKVLTRMLLLNETVDEWETNRNTSINLLATRVQLGQTTMAVTSDLVAKGYANLSGYLEESMTAQLAYLPDPVCARLAMCMMDEDFVCELPSKGKIVQGKDKKWWTEKLKEILSSGIVSPEKGDFGEVIGALYMLFCADMIRKRINDDNRLQGMTADNRNMAHSHQAYIQFSVSLDEWLYSLETGGKLRDASSSIMDKKAYKVSVGFIQVCRNSLRYYKESWKSLADQSFLKHVYESGTAFFVFQGCPLIDMVIPLHIETATGTKSEFVPMLVSIQGPLSVGPEKAEDICAAMKAKATAGGLKKALCLLIVFGSEGSERAPQTAPHATTEVSEELIRGIVTKSIFVPENDDFGLSGTFHAMTPIAKVHAEMFASHPFIMAHGGNQVDSDELDADKALRKMSLQVLVDKFNSLRKALTGPKSLWERIREQG